MSLTENEKLIAEGVLYLLSLGMEWCKIEKQYKMERRKLEHLVCLYRSELKEGKI